MNVTPFQASEENSDPTIEAAIAENKTIPPIETQLWLSESNVFAPQASIQLAFQTSASKASVKPKNNQPEKRSYFDKRKKSL